MNSSRVLCTCLCSNKYPATAQSQYLIAIGRDNNLSTLCNSCGFAYQLKMFPGPDYLCFGDGVVLTMAFPGKFAYMTHNFILLWLNSSKALEGIAIGRDSDLSTLCHSCRLACQQRVLKMSPGPG